MIVQGSGYTRAAGAEAEHCNGNGALRQGAATAHDKGGLRGVGGRKKWNEAEWYPPSLL